MEKLWTGLKWAAIVIEIIAFVLLVCFAVNIYYEFFAYADGIQEEVWVLCEKDGVIAVYKSGQNRPELVTDIETPVLRRADRAMLAKGIPAEDLDEVLTLLEDFGS